MPNGCHSLGERNGRRGRAWPRTSGTPIDTAARMRMVHDEARVRKGAVDELFGINQLLTITPQHCLSKKSRQRTTIRRR